MKKAIWIVLGIIVVVIAGLAIFVGTYSPAQRKTTDLIIEPTPARVARGKYLVQHVVGCMGCHSKRDWSRYAGPVVGAIGTGSECFTEAQGVPGRVCPANLSSDKQTGLGGWTDDEILRAMREGIDKDGNALFPMMPFTEYRHLSDEDAQAVIAYLRTLPPVKNKVQKSEIKFPVSFFIKRIPKPLEGRVQAPDRSDSLKYGEYLTTVAGCKVCHTPVDDQNRPITEKAFSGGRELSGPFGTVRSANITSHKTGLGNISRQQFIGRFKSFADPEILTVKVPKGENTVMPWLEYAGMKEEDLGAIYEFLRTVPAIENQVEKYPKSE